MRLIISYVILLAAVLAAYSNVFNNEFFYDDAFLITNNKFIQSWHYLPQIFSTTLTAGSDINGVYYRPLQALLYLITFKIAGLSTTAFHALNVGLHSLNACLVITLGYRLGFNRWATLAATLVWAVHPIHTEAVTYMSATADTLYTFFCLLGILVLLPDFSRRRILWCCVFFFLALLSKEDAIAFPLLAMSMLYLKSDRRFDMTTYIRLWPLGIVAAAYLVIHFALPLHGLPPHSVTPSTPSPVPPSLMPFATLPLYGRLLLVPVQLYMEHDLILGDHRIIYSIIAGFGLAIFAAIQTIQTQKPVTLPASWGLLWFFGAHLPVFYVDNIVYEHWMYMPSIGLFLGMGEMLARMLSARVVTGRNLLPVCSIILSVIVAVSFGLMTYNQNKLWHDPVTFYGNMIAQSTAAPKAHANLGSYYTLHNDFGKALTEYNLAIKESGDTEAEVQNDIAITLQAMPDRDLHVDDILAHFHRALDIDPNNYAALTNMTNFYIKHGDPARAEVYHQRADALRRRFKTLPDDPARE